MRFVVAAFNYDPPLTTHRSYSHSPRVPDLAKYKSFHITPQQPDDILTSNISTTDIGHGPRLAPQDEMCFVRHEALDSFYEELRAEIEMKRLRRIREALSSETPLLSLPRGTALPFPLAFRA